MKPSLRACLCARGACALMLCSSQVLAEDLLDIYNAALDNDPVFQSQALTLKAEQQGPDISRADLLPNVQLFAARARNDDEVTGSGGFTQPGDATFDTNEYGVNVRQTIYNRDRFLAYDQSKLEASVAEAEFEAARQELILRVVDRYLGVLSAQDNVELAIAERRAINRQLELARSRLDVGLGTTTDLHDAKARFELAQAREIRAQQSLEDAQEALSELIGRRAGPLDTLREDSPLDSPTPGDSDVWVERARENNVPLLTARLNEEIRDRAVSRQGARRLPTVDLVVSHNVADQDGSLGGGEVTQYSTAARLQLEIPIFQGGGIAAGKRQAVYRHQAAQQQTNAARRSATREARSAFLDVTTSAREAIALDQAVVASEQALESRQEGFEAGLNTNLDVLDAQSDLFQARRDYLSARYQYIRSRLRLYQVAGELEVEDLETVNDWLE